MWTVVYCLLGSFQPHSHAYVVAVIELRFRLFAMRIVAANIALFFFYFVPFAAPLDQGELQQGVGCFKGSSQVSYFTYLTFSLRHNGAFKPSRYLSPVYI